MEEAAFGDKISQACESYASSISRHKPRHFGTERPMSTNFLCRLSSYSQNPVKQDLENFTTEVIVHLINEDPAFRRIFIRHIIRDGRVARGFRRAKAESQVPLGSRSDGSGIVDIVLRGAGRQILIEVKISADETETKVYGKGWMRQLRKYLHLRRGDVAFLTTKDIDSPEIPSERFLGQCYFEDLYAKLKRRNRSLSPIGQIFLGFLEENDMIPVDPFNKSDLRIARQAISFKKKCVKILNEMITYIEPVVRKQRIITRPRFSRSQHISSRSRCVYSYARFPKWSNWRYLTVWVGPDDTALDFGLLIEGYADKNMLKLQKHFAGWSSDSNSLCSSHPVRAGMSIEKMADVVIRDVRKLGVVLSKVGR